MKINSASRLHNLMSGWRPISNDQAAIQGWLQVLSLASENETRDYMRINQNLQVLLDELDLMRERLILSKHSEAVFQPPLQKLEQAFSPKLIGMNAVHVKQFLSDDVFVALGFCSELLPQEEDGLKAEDFSELVGLINQLELLLQDNDFPAQLTSLIRKHIRLAELAIAQYPIRGATALKDAVKIAVGDLIFESEILASTTPERAANISNLWRRMNQIADAAIKIDSLWQLGGRAAKLLSDLNISG